MKLSQKEINRRIQEWRNIKTLHEKSRAKNEKLKKENKEQQKEIEELKKKNIELQAITEKQALQIEELQEMVFGGKKKKEDDQENSTDDSTTSPKEKNQERKRAIEEKIQNLKTSQKQNIMPSMIVQIVGVSSKERRLSFFGKKTFRFLLRKMQKDMILLSTK